MGQQFYYFGCIGSPGHYLHDVNGRSVRMTNTPWGNQIDTGLLDKKAPQRQGEGVLVQKDGWTALSFWDRSVDGRSGSNSAFILNGTATFDEMLALANDYFPKVVGRFDFPITMRA